MRQLVELKAMLDAGARINIPAVSDFLSAWLRQHILTLDLKLAAALSQRSSDRRRNCMSRPRFPFRIVTDSGY